MKTYSYKNRCNVYQLFVQVPKYRIVTVKDLTDDELEVGDKVQGRYQNKWLVCNYNVKEFSYCMHYLETVNDASISM